LVEQCLPGEAQQKLLAVMPDSRPSVFTFLPLLHREPLLADFNYYHNRFTCDYEQTYPFFVTATLIVGGWGKAFPDSATERKA
jgi:hypothetical protein